MEDRDKFIESQWDGPTQGTIPIGTLPVYTGERVRFQTRITSSMIPTGLPLYVYKVERAPDGTKVVWVTSERPENA